MDHTARVRNFVCSKGSRVKTHSMDSGIKAHSMDAGMIQAFAKSNQLKLVFAPTAAFSSRWLSRPQAAANP